MKKINRSDIDFSKLEPVKTLNKENILFVDRDSNLVYKFFVTDDSQKRREIEEKLIRLDELKKKYLSKMDGLIYSDGLDGYTQEIVKGDSLLELVHREKQILKQMKNIIRLSKNLEDLHKNGVIVGDMNFSNLIINKKNKPVFIDQDSFSVDELKGHDVSTLLGQYYGRKNMGVEINENSDRIGLYLSLFYAIFRRELCVISNDTYINTKEYPFLYDLYEVYHDLSYRGERVPEVPYLHKVLKNYN